MAWSVLSPIAVALWHNPPNEKNSRRFPRWWRRASQRCSSLTDRNFPTATRLAGRTHPVPGPDGPPGRSAQTHRHSHPAAVQHPVAKWLDLAQHVSPAHSAGDDPAISQTATESARTILA